MASAFGKAAAKAKSEQSANSKFIRWQPKVTAEGFELKGAYEPIKGKLLEVRPVETKEFSGKTRNIYPMVLETADGQKEFSASGALVVELDKAGVQIGDTVVMSRTGESFETRYSVSVVK